MDLFDLLGALLPESRRGWALLLVPVTIAAAAALLLFAILHGA